jgi:hypothetical protein
MRDQTISYWLAVTPSESEHLEALLPASIFQPAPEKPARIVVPVRQRLAHRREVPHEKAFRCLGGVAATQSGTWNVGLTGTPNVNVANPATAPALFLNVNDPGRIPYHQGQPELARLGAALRGFHWSPPTIDWSSNTSL